MFTCYKHSKPEQSLSFIDYQLVRREKGTRSVCAGGENGEWARKFCDQIKVAAIGGSIRKASYSNGLIRAAIELSKESIVGMEIEHLDISQLPMQNIDLEGEDHEGSFPPAVEDLRQKILESDRILFSSPEFNYSVSAPLKNAIDWASRPPNVWADKAAAIISASAGMGGARGQLHLRQIGVFIDLHFINKPEFFLNVFQPPAKFDSQGNLIDENTKERLKEVLLALQAFTWRLKNGNKCLTFAESGST